MKQLRGNWRILPPGTWSYPALLWWVDDCGFICTKSGQLMDGGPWDLGSPPQCCQVYPTPTACCSDRTECGSKHLLEKKRNIRRFFGRARARESGIVGHDGWMPGATNDSCQPLDIFPQTATNATCTCSTLPPLTVFAEIVVSKGMIAALSMPAHA